MGVGVVPTKQGGNLGSDGVLGFNFGMMLKPDKDYLYLNEDSRASDDKGNQEIFPDVAAVVFGLHEEDFFSKADVYNPDNRIGFARYGPYVKEHYMQVYINTSSILLKVPQSQSNCTYDEGA